jgi:hypothetical protein
MRGKRDDSRKAMLTSKFLVHDRKNCTGRFLDSFNIQLVDLFIGQISSASGPRLQEEEQQESDGKGVPKAACSWNKGVKLPRGFAHQFFLQRKRRTVGQWLLPLLS